MTQDDKNRFEVGTRESMGRLPRIAQPILTWIAGKPLDADESIVIIPRVIDVILTPMLMVSAITGLIHLAMNDILLSWIGIIPLWLVVVGLLRKIQVTHMHHAIHNCLFDRPALNKVYQNLMPSLTFIQNGSEYKKEHLEHHNASIFTTRNDADAAFLAQLGFIPGRTRRELWINLWMTIFSPVFHLLFARARLGSIFIRATPLATGLAMAMICAHVALALLVGWKVFLIAVIIPMFPLYHVSALLQFLTEHAWNVAGGSVRNWAEYTERCWGRFCGETYPIRSFSGLRGLLSHQSRVLAWAFRMALVHLPVRVACLVSDLPVHDWHHMAHIAGQSPRDWSRSIYLRQVAIADGDRPGFSQRELWGMRNMIEHSFGWLESIICNYMLPGTEQSMPNDHAILMVGETK